MASLSEPDVTPNPKPRARIRASQSDWSDLHEIFQHEPCVSCNGRPIELHHIVPRSQGGDDVIENLAPLYHPCHMRLEGHAPGREHVAARIRRYVNERESRRRYVMDTIGLERFSRRYPEPPHLALGDLSRPSRPLELSE